jgi:hypothetical protein
MGSCSLQHTQPRRSTRSRASQARFAPPSGFGYPLDGFLPSRSCRLCFVPAALMGFALRSFFLLRGIAGVSTDKNPPAVLLCGIPAAEATSRPAEPRLLGFAPRGSPSRTAAVLAHPPLEAPVGFPLPRFASDSLHRDFAQCPLTRFRRTGGDRSRCASGYLSAVARPHSTAGRSPTAAKRPP